MNIKLKAHCVGKCYYFKLKAHCAGKVYYIHFTKTFGFRCPVTIFEKKYHNCHITEPSIVSIAVWQLVYIVNTVIDCFEW
jgi:hypothetical protein